MTDKIEKIYRRHEVEALTGKSRSTLYHDMACGNFPKPIRIGHSIYEGRGAVGWPESVLNAWLASVKAKSHPMVGV